MTIQGNDIIALVTGGVLENYTSTGGGDTPSSPIISAVTGADSITVTIDGDSGVTNQVNYKLSTDSEWSDGGSRLGDGDVVIDGLSAGAYYIIAYSDNDGNHSSPSNLLMAYVTTETTIEAALYELLLSDATITSIVGSDISPMMLFTADVIPSITYQQLTGVRNHTLLDSGDMVESLFQINCYTDDYGTGRELSDAVRSLLDSYSGVIGGVTIQAIHMDSEGDLYDMEEDVKKTEIFGKRLTFKIWFNE